MKRLFKVLTIFFVTILITTLCIIVYFKNSLMIVYNVYEELKNSNESVETLGKLINYDITNSMDNKNVKYKETSSKDVFLDIYKSNIDNKTSPVILYVHGGSWIYGDNGIPIGLEPILNAFNKRGYTIISVSYELLKENTPMDNPIKDVKDSIRWIYKNKDKYNFDTNNIGILGVSSGAHLALMASYSDDDEFIGDKSLEKYPSKVKYVLDIFGPTDLNTLDPSSIEEEYKDDIKKIINSPDVLRKLSPMDYITSSSPNTLIIHSKTDEIVPYENAKSLYINLKDNGVKSKLLTLESGSHYFNGYSEPEIAALIFEVLKFLDINNK
ncbi:alpha/beta hydrolase [Clostridium sp. AL.422]|uniref:alpha/beta hydrolase n=1 Tax=Clostridium TaxID=1485 RepID=UPI00293DFC81|nr:MULTISPECIES: alpha/beta hydrolase [unclassified Clostridium]MDV4151769.1 alpha/beta hydrolase [Clostridium sp. AL.422]